MSLSLMKEIENWKSKFLKLNFEHETIKTKYEHLMNSMQQSKDLIISECEKKIDLINNENKKILEQLQKDKEVAMARVESETSKLNEMEKINKRYQEEINEINGLIQLESNRKESLSLRLIDLTNKVQELQADNSSLDLQIERKIDLKILAGGNQSEENNGFDYMPTTIKQRIRHS
ncbi:hypothetical protein ROZALSC1DRAFT_31735 [Rozella allomycis CSF55]|uniref:Uncharacterized protein n=1 Tax=Rozella allomycis (strain CSF55) TaxID=988480 RepID=A0A4P9YAM8_ROZAC|nr:hypothetical protein ROZALSC1DRAFT_31735 [Rozella allomycis CSF55]